MKKPLTTGEAGKYCNVTHVTIIKWIKQGKLKAYRTPGGRYQIQPQDLIEFLYLYKMPIPKELLTKTRILVIDDNPKLMDFIINTLQNEKKNYDLASALNGYDAAMQIINFKPHVVIVNTKTPGVDGIQVCRSIKDNPETEKIKVLAIVDKAEEEKEILRCGVEHCLRKPLNIDELRRYVAKLALAV
ncbi:MAG: response regulator [Candidatus Poribacteria bacterium]